MSDGPFDEGPHGHSTQTLTWSVADGSLSPGGFLFSLAPQTPPDPNVGHTVSFTWLPSGWGPAD
jgi:hypothetical protein